MARNFQAKYQVRWKFGASLFLRLGEFFFVWLDHILAIIIIIIVIILRSPVCLSHETDEGEQKSHFAEVQ